jgi:hypothetical protein
MESNVRNPNVPRCDAYVVDGENAFWMKMGVAWRHDDGKG